MFIVYVTLAKVGQVYNMSRSQCCPLYCRGNERQAPPLNGNLISLTCNLVDPLCERGTIVAREAESVGLIQQVCRTMQRLRMDNIVSMIVFFKMQIFTF